MTKLDEPLARALQRIFDADAGSYSTFQPIFAHLSDRPIAVRPPINGIEDLLIGPMRALAEKGLIELDAGTHRKLFGAFRLTDEGRKVAIEASGPQPSLEAPQALSEDWAAMTPILHALKRAGELEWKSGGGATLSGVHDQASGQEAGAVAYRLNLLTQEGYAKNAGPGMYRLTEKGRQITSRWPSNADDPAILDRLIAALDDVAQNGSPKRKEEVNAVRSFFLEFGPKASAELVAKAVGIQ